VSRIASEGTDELERLDGIGSLLSVYAKEEQWQVVAWCGEGADDEGKSSLCEQKLGRIKAVDKVGHCYPPGAFEPGVWWVRTNRIPEVTCHSHFPGNPRDIDPVLGKFQKSKRACAIAYHVTADTNPADISYM
jgi:hypothetical protein